MPISTSLNFRAVPVARDPNTNNRYEGSGTWERIMVRMVLSVSSFVTILLSGDPPATSSMPDAGYIFFLHNGLIVL